VVTAGWVGGYGNLVEIRHLDGSLTRYAHNSRILVSCYASKFLKQPKLGAGFSV